MFELPSRRDVAKCVITRETIEKGIRPTLVTEGGAELAEELEETRLRDLRGSALAELCARARSPIAMRSLGYPRGGAARRRPLATSRSRACCSTRSRDARRARPSCRRGLPEPATRARRPAGDPARGEARRRPGRVHGGDRRAALADRGVWLLALGAAHPRPLLVADEQLDDALDALARAGGREHPGTRRIRAVEDDLRAVLAERTRYDARGGRARVLERWIERTRLRGQRGRSRRAVRDRACRRRT